MIALVGVSMSGMPGPPVGPSYLQSAIRLQHSRCARNMGDVHNMRNTLLLLPQMYGSDQRSTSEPQIC
jgi:hypothetical protein